MRTKLKLNQINQVSRTAIAFDDVPAWQGRLGRNAAPYALFSWADATAVDLAAALSLGLRWRGALVGWLIAHRVDARTVRYSSVYVAPAHHGRARGLALLAEAFARQHDAGIRQAKAAIQAGNAVAWPTFERRVRDYFPVVSQARSARVQLQGAVTPAAP